MIEYEGRRYLIKKSEITDTHGNTHGWFCRVQSEDGLWRVVRRKHKLEKFPMLRSSEALTVIVDEVTEGLFNGTLVAEPRPDVQAAEPQAR